MVEIGVWRGDRGIRFIESGSALRRYVGFDLFEAMSEETFLQEKMGACTPQSRAGVCERLGPVAQERRCEIELIAGRTEETLTAFAQAHPGEFDFVYLDGGHSLETVASDWANARQLIKPSGLIIFDDYYLNDASRGAKPLVDSLLAQNAYEVRFFPMVMDIAGGLQITMVSVRPRAS